jgi:hypothetical protein
LQLEGCWGCGRKKGALGVGGTLIHAFKLTPRCSKSSVTTLRAVSPPLFRPCWRTGRRPMHLHLAHKQRREGNDVSQPDAGGQTTQQRAFHWTGRAGTRPTRCPTDDHQFRQKKQANYGSPVSERDAKPWWSSGTAQANAAHEPTGQEAPHRWPARPFPLSPLQRPLQQLIWRRLNLPGRAAIGQEGTAGIVRQEMELVRFGDTANATDEWEMNHRCGSGSHWLAWSLAASRAQRVSRPSAQPSRVYVAPSAEYLYCNDTPRRSRTLFCHSAWRIPLVAEPGSVGWRGLAHRTKDLSRASGSCGACSSYTRTPLKDRNGTFRR